LAFGKPALAENGKNSPFIKMLPFLNMTEIFSEATAKTGDKAQSRIGLCQSCNRGPVMKKFLLASIATMVAFTPAAYAQTIPQAEAIAQDSAGFQRGEGRRGGWGQGQRGGQERAEQNEGGQRERRWRGRDQQQEQAQQQSQERSRGGWNRGEERREEQPEGRWGRRQGDWGARPDAQPQATPQPARQPRWERGGSNTDGDRGSWRGRGNRDGGSIGGGERREERRPGWNNGGNADGQPRGGNWNRGEERRYEERDNDGWRGNRDRRDDQGYGRGGYERRDEARGGDWNRGGNYSRHGRYRDRDHGNWDRGWRNDRRYNWRGHRDRYSNYYRPGRYYAPHRRDYYRRFSVGIYLGSPYYSDRYWISDPWQYRLPEAYGPYRWVRYYDDVLLIDMRSGYVVDVIHDFFW
jgi:hypothetical protein